MKSIVLPKLGKRVYLHGTTLYDALVSNLQDLKNIDFKLRRIFFTNEVFIYHSAPEDCPKDVYSCVFYTEEGMEKCLYVYPGKIELPDFIEEFNEAEEIFDLEKKNNTVLIKASPYNFIKTVVSINKIVLSPYRHIDDAYLFAQIYLSHNIKSPENISLKFDKNVGSFFYTSIYDFEKKVGFLCFRKLSKSEIEREHEVFRKRV